jgi:hypothetical protein
MCVLLCVVEPAGEDAFHLNWNEKYASGEWSSFPVQPPPGM